MKLPKMKNCDPNPKSCDKKKNQQENNDIQKMHTMYIKCFTHIYLVVAF